MMDTIKKGWMLGLVVACVSCLDDGCPDGEDLDDYSSPPPTFEPTLVPDELPSVWALLRQASVLVYVEDTAFVQGGWQHQTVWSTYRVEWAWEDGERFLQIEEPCELVPGPIYVQTVVGVRVMETVIPENVYQFVPPAQWEGRVTGGEETEEGIMYELFPGLEGAQYWVLGADLEDPVSQGCPLSAQDPAVVDQDRDGYPGITVEQWVNGELSARCYICSRTVYTFGPGTISFEDGHHQITGEMFDVVVDQTRFGSDSEDYPPGVLPTEWNPDGNNWYWLIGLDDTATCEDVRAVFELP